MKKQKYLKWLTSQSLLAVMLVVVIVFSFTACGNNDEGANSSDSGAATSAEGESSADTEQIEEGSIPAIGDKYLDESLLPDGVEYTLHENIIVYGYTPYYDDRLSTSSYGPVTIHEAYSGPLPPFGYGINLYVYYADNGRYLCGWEITESSYAYGYYDEKLIPEGTASTNGGMDGKIIRYTGEREFIFGFTNIEYMELNIVIPEGFEGPLPPVDTPVTLDYYFIDNTVDPCYLVGWLLD